MEAPVVVPNNLLNIVLVINVASAVAITLVNKAVLSRLQFSPCFVAAMHCFFGSLVAAVMTRILKIYQLPDKELSTELISLTEGIDMHHSEDQGPSKLVETPLLEDEESMAVPRRTKDADPGEIAGQRGLLILSSLFGLAVMVAGTNTFSHYGLSLSPVWQFQFFRLACTPFAAIMEFCLGYHSLTCGAVCGLLLIVVGSGVTVLWTSDGEAQFTCGEGCIWCILYNVCGVWCQLNTKIIGHRFNMDPPNIIMISSLFVGIILMVLYALYPPFRGNEFEPAAWTFLATCAFVLTCILGAALQISSVYVAKIGSVTYLAAVSNFKVMLTVVGGAWMYSESISFHHIVGTVICLVGFSVYRDSIPGLGTWLTSLVSLFTFDQASRVQRDETTL